MRLIKALISVALVADAAVASSNSWFSKAGKYSNHPVPLSISSNFPPCMRWGVDAYSVCPTYSLQQVA